MLKIMSICQHDPNKVIFNYSTYNLSDLIYPKYNLFEDQLLPFELPSRNIYDDVNEGTYLTRTKSKLKDKCLLSLRINNNKKVKHYHVFLTTITPSFEIQ